MAKSVTLPVENGQIRSAVNAFLKDLLEKKVVEAVMVPVKHPSNNDVVQTLVTDAGYLEQADVFAPVMPVVSARILQSMTRITTVDRKTAVVMRPCEMRALVELVKLRQAQLDGILLIGIDCPGTYPVEEYELYAAEKTSDDFVKAAAGRSAEEEAKLRAGCRICAHTEPMTADIVIGLTGLDASKEILVQADTERGVQVLEELGLSAEDDSGQAQKRREAVDKAVADMEEKRKAFFEKTAEEIGGIDNISAVFAPCINCHNCRAVCPVCYCRECFFESPTFELEAEKYMGLAEKKGAIRMPTDTLLFHLTRMNHMGASCIGCGACEEACPSSIPLLKIFQLIGDKVQKLFEYVPGRSLEEELPPTAFKEDELEWIGEK